MHRKRPRLTPEVYVGRRRWFITICTSHRKPHFRDATIVALALDEFHRAAARFDVEVLAYCFMPDHIHLVLEGVSDEADVEAFVHHAKQMSGYHFGQRCKQPLWQPSYYDRVLRANEDTLSVVRYTFENPIRAGIVDRLEDYPFLGSSRFSVKDVIEAERWQP